MFFLDPSSYKSIWPETSFVLKFYQLLLESFGLDLLDSCSDCLMLFCSPLDSSLSDEDCESLDDSVADDDSSLLSTYCSGSGVEATASLGMSRLLESMLPNLLV